MKDLQADYDTLNKLLENRAKLEEEIQKKQIGLRGSGQARGMNSDLQKRMNELSDLQQKLEDINDDLKVFGADTPEKANKVLADLKKQMDGAVPALIDMKRAELQDLAAKNQKISSMERLVTRYKELSGAQKLDQAQKTELISITNQLKAEYPDLHALMDEEGRIRIQNIDYIEDQIGAERALIQGSVDSAKAYISNLQKMTDAQRVSVETQIKNYENLLKAMQAVAGTQTTGPKKESGTVTLRQANPLLGQYAESYATDNLKPTQDKLNDLYDEQNRYAQAQLELKKLANSLSSSGLTLFFQVAPGSPGAPVMIRKSKRERPPQSSEKTPTTPQSPRCNIRPKCTTGQQTSRSRPMRRCVNSTRSTSMNQSKTSGR